MPPPNVRAVRSVLPLVLVVWSPGARAYCGTWNPALSAEISDDLGSKAVTLTTAAGPAPCANLADEDWDGSSWGDTTPIEFYWDGLASGGPTHDCINNLGATVRLVSSPGIAKEVLMFRLLDSDSLGCVTGLDDDLDGTVNDIAIVYSSLANG